MTAPIELIVSQLASINCRLDKIEAAASVEDPKSLYEAQAQLLLSALVPPPATRKDN